MKRTKTSKEHGFGERVALAIIALLSLVDSVIILGTLTLVDSDYRAQFLFSDACNWLEGRYR